MGDEANCFYVELLAVADREQALATHGPSFVDAAGQGRGLCGVRLRTERLSVAVAELSGRGAAFETSEVRDSAGALVCEVARQADQGPCVVELGLVQYAPSHALRYERRVAAGLTSHGFPLKRLDHLAAMAPDLDGQMRYWTDVLGVPLYGEVRSPVMVIRQFKIGDAIVELLGPATADSPIARRPAGLASMTAFEVPNLDAAVALARERGFTPSEPGTGALPGTRTATIPAAELSGLALQLLEYL